MWNLRAQLAEVHAASICFQDLWNFFDLRLHASSRRWSAKTLGLSTYACSILMISIANSKGMKNYLWFAKQMLDSELNQL
jgi:hypothetical protein